MASPGRLEEIFSQAGEPTEEHVFPDGPTPRISIERLAEVSGDLDVVWTDGPALDVEELALARVAEAMERETASGHRRLALVTQP
jgi:hypothetical protein